MMFLNLIPRRYMVNLIPFPCFTFFTACPKYIYKKLCNTQCGAGLNWRWNSIRSHNSGDGVVHNSFGQKLMRIYNQKGIFSNTKDSEEGLTHILSEHFENVKTKVQGTVVMFSASGKIASNRSTFLHKACLRFFNYSDTSLPSHSFLRIIGI